MKKIYSLLKKMVFFAVACSFAPLVTGQVQITDVNGLKAIGNELTGSYILMNSITLTDGWTPIGTEATPFTGSFDGNGYTISGLSTDNSTSDYQGLFGYAVEATIKNLGIENATIKGKDYVGAIAGHLKGGSIRQCYVNNSSIEGNNATGSMAGQISNSALIENCYATNTVAVFTQSQAGGLVGVMRSGKVSKCYFAGTVEAAEARANGIVGLIEPGENADKSIEYTVNLAPSLIVKSDRAYPYHADGKGVEHARIVDKAGEEITLTKNFSLLETILGKNIETATTLPNEEALVMSFNTPYFSDSESNEIKRWNYRREAIVTAIKQEKPVILGMQEIRYDPQLAYLDSQLSDEYGRIGVGRDDGKKGGDYSVIFYRKDMFELIKTGDFWMSETPDVPSYGWGESHRRLTTWGHFRLKGTEKEVLIYNTHLAYGSDKAREESIKMMRDSIVGRLAPNVQTVIATGDYNENTINAIFRPFWGLLESTRDEAPETDKRITYNSWANTSSERTVDHIFYRNCIPQSFKVLTGVYGGVTLMSDHYPILAKLDIPMDDEYGADRAHGASIIKASDTKTKAFYNYKLGWDFAGVWTIAEGSGLPTLKVFNKTASYEIADAAGLKAIANDLNGHYKLTKDITLTEAWTPLGSEATPFTGVLDGNGKVITGLAYGNNATKKVGLFSVVEGATITKLGIENARMDGDADVAAIAGVMKGGLMEECYVTNSYIEGRDHVASLVGKIYDGATLQNCYSNANVYSRATQAGGLCGVILDTGTKISRSYFAGKVATATGKSRPASIVALVDNNGLVTVDYCLNLASSIIGSSNVRIAHWGSYGGSTLLASNYSLSTTAMNAAGGTVSATDTNYGADKMHGENLPDDNDALTSAFYTSVLGWDFSGGIWKMLPAGGYPVFTWQQAPVSVTVFEVKNGVMLPSSSLDLSSLVALNNAKNVIEFTTTTPGVNISSDNLLTIDDPEAAPETITVNIAPKSGFSFTAGAPASFSVLTMSDVLLIGNAADLAKVESFPGAHFKLTADIDMKGVAFNGLCSEIDPFTGTFDGDGYVISNVTISSSGTRGVGFFNATKGATIKNLGLEKASVKQTSNHKSAGGIIGLMRGGVLEQCYTANAYVEGYDHVGSVVGSIEGLNEAADDGAVIKNCYGADNEVYSRSYQAGGFSGTLMKGSVENCYFSGLVRSGNRAIGLAGYVDNSGHKATDVVVRNSLNLATELKSSNSDRSRMFRILDNGGSRPSTMANNYSISTTNFSSTEGATATATVETTANGRNGANLPDDSDAKAEVFYTAKLHWDLEAIWQIDEGVSYPTLRVFDKSTPPLPPDPPAGIEATEKNGCTAFVQDNTLFVRNLPASAIVSIYTASGQQISSLKAMVSEISQPLPFKGIYLVEVIDQENRTVIKVIN